VKRLWLFCALAALFLGSAVPPPPRLPIDSAGLEPYTACPLHLRIGCILFTYSEAVPAAAPKAPTAAREVAPEPKSAVRILISIPQQRAYVFDGGALLATAPVSTGKPGHETPVGRFRILEKAVHHRSNKYSNAPMPFMQRLTMGGVALHAGHLPGYPASHGCIRLPWGFAKRLYGLTNFATRVTITRARPRSARDAANLA
jgi:hypothetical protein